MVLAIIACPIKCMYYVVILYTIVYRWSGYTRIYVKFVNHFFIQFFFLNIRKNYKIFVINALPNTNFLLFPKISYPTYIFRHLHSNSQNSQYRYIVNCTRYYTVVCVFFNYNNKTNLYVLLFPPQYYCEYLVVLCVIPIIIPIIRPYILELFTKINDSRLLQCICIIYCRNKKKIL